MCLKFAYNFSSTARLTGPLQFINTWSIELNLDQLGNYITIWEISIWNELVSCQIKPIYEVKYLYGGENKKNYPN